MVWDTKGYNTTCSWQTQTIGIMYNKAREFTFWNQVDHLLCVHKFEGANILSIPKYWYPTIHSPHQVDHLNIEIWNEEHLANEMQLVKSHSYTTMLHRSNGQHYA